jgi:acetyltransferase-like isoleucine patch superfamily enzyme
MYTHGGCFVPGKFDRFTTIGRYCSIAMTATAMNRNHPLGYKSTHAFFFNPKLKYCELDEISYTPLVIGSDVWIGHSAIIHPNVKSIGHGAVIGAGAVINKDIPPYAVVVGNPARIVRYRFSPEVIEELLSGCWWDKDIDELKSEMKEFQNFIRGSSSPSIPGDR